MTPTRTDTIMTQPTPSGTIEIFGNTVPRADVAAIYLADPDCWVDMPEASPRARCGMTADPVPGGNRHVYVMVDGTCRFDAAVVMVDVYAVPPQ